MDPLARCQRLPFSWLCHCALAITSLAVVPAGIAQELRWKFTEGDEWLIKCDQTAEVVSTISSTATTMTLDTGMELVWKVESVEDDGDAVIAQRFQRLRMKLELPKVASPISYDSASEAKPTGDAKSIAQAVDPLLNAQARITLSPRGEIRSVELDESAQKAVDSLSAGQALKSLLSEEGLANVLRQSLVVLPASAVKTGDQWSHETTLATPLGPGQQHTTFTLLEPDQKSPNVARIESESKITFAESTVEKRPSLERQQQRGTISFDTEAGRLRSAEVEQQLVTASKLKETPVRVSLSSTLKTTLEPK